MDFINNMFHFLKSGINLRRVLIEDGDSLWTISEKHNVCSKELQSLNSLKSDLIFAGEYLLLPPIKKTIPSSPRFSHSRLTVTTPSPPSPSPPPSTSVSLPVSNSTTPFTPKGKTKPIVVKEGDTAWDIAEKFGITLDELSECNEFVSDMIYPGDVLHLPEHAFLPKQKHLHFTKAVMDWKIGSPDFDFFDVFPRHRDVEEYRIRLRGLLDGMRQVETSFIMPAPKGDDGLSIGPLQISEDYHSDAWWLMSSPAPYDKCEDVDYSERTVVKYWLRYCPWAIEFEDFATLAKIHNGGPRFWRHVKTAIYWRKVKSAMRKFGHYKGIPELDPLLSSNTLCNNGTTILFQQHISFDLKTLNILNNGGSQKEDDAFTIANLQKIIDLQKQSLASMDDTK